MNNSHSEVALADSLLLAQQENRIVDNVICGLGGSLQFVACVSKGDPAPVAFAQFLTYCCLEVGQLTA